MPKMKTHKGTAKRIRVTKAGKMLQESAAMHHKLSRQTARNKRAKAAPKSTTGERAKVIRRALGI